MSGAAAFGAFPKGDGRLPSGLVPAPAVYCAGGRPVSVMAVSGKPSIAAESSCCFVDMSFSSERSSISEFAFAPEELSMLENFLSGSADATTAANLSTNLNVAGTSLASYGARQVCLPAQAQAQPFKSPAAASPLQMQDILGLPSLEIGPAGMLATAPCFGQAAMLPTRFSSNNMLSSEQQQQQQQRRPSSVAPWQPTHTTPSLLLSEGSASMPAAPASAAPASAAPPTVPWPWGQSLSSQLPQTQHQQQQQLLLQAQQHQQQQQPQAMQILSFSADAQLPQGLASWQPYGGDGGDLAVDERLLAEIEAAPWPDFLPSPFNSSFADHQAQLHQPLHQSPPPQPPPPVLLKAEASSHSSVPGSFLPSSSSAAAAAAAPDGMAICGQGTFAPSASNGPSRQPSLAVTELMLCRQFEYAMTDRAQTPEPPRHAALPAAAAAAAPPPMHPASGVSAASGAAAAAVFGFGAGGGKDGCQGRSSPSNRDAIIPVPMNVTTDAAAAAMSLRRRGSGAVGGAAALHRASDPHGVQLAVPAAAAAAGGGVSRYHYDMAAVPTAPATGSAGGGPISAVLSGDGTGTAAGTDDTDDGCEAETGASSGGGGGAAAAAADAPSARARAAAAAAAAVVKVQRGALTIETLRAMFELPSQDVVRALGISATDLKRRCRALGIRRWPHRKLASLQRLAQAVDADSDLPPQEREAVLESVAANRSQIFRDPNADLAPNLKVLRQVQYKRHFMEKRGFGH
ncbi:hypothetical protein PLESTB_001019100 [Pleodorina starrii]|uniref:RWP-RK domain-containing protein n=1 Tax=Pleodorina starrii TaxID=330485 RepID=A0A9W6F4P7_9CHLO|nr:hypothetical protein PLESTB_001019100 [Pleodorina starrii]